MTFQYKQVIIFCMRVRIRLGRGVLDTTLCDKVCQ